MRAIKLASLKKVVHFMARTDGSLQRRAVRSGVWVAVSSVGVAGLTFARGIVLARLLTPDVFGLMAATLMATRLIDIFTESGFGAALIHRQKRFEEARDTAFTLLCLRGFVLAGLSFAIAPWVASFYDEPVMQSIVGVVGLSFVVLGFQNVNWVLLQKELNFKRLTLMEVSGGVLSFAVTVGLAYWLRNVWALVYAQIASAAITTALSFILIPGRVSFRFDWEIALELRRYGRFITGLVIVIFATRELDNLLIGKMLGMEMLGYYVVAYTLANIPATYVSKLVGKVLFPMFSQLQDDLPKLREAYAKGIRLVTTVTVPASVGMIVLAPEIVRALYGAKWAEAAAPLAVLSVFGCFRALWTLNGYLCNGIGKPQVDFYSNLGRLMIMAALLMPLTARFGLIGASIAVTVPMVMQFVFGLFLSRRLIAAPLRIAGQPLAVAAGQGAVMALVVIAAKSRVAADAGLALVSLVAIGATVYAALNYREIRNLYVAYAMR